MGLLLLALAAGVLLLLVAAFRFALGAPASAGFWTIFFTPLLVAARFAGQSPPEVAFWSAGGVLVLTSLLCVVAILTNRRLPDVILNAMLAFQLFFVARFANTFLTPTGTPEWTALSLAQQLNFVLGVLLLLACWLAWTMRPKPSTPYQSSAPSRITRFLRKRRLPSRILGTVLMALAVIAVSIIARFAFWQASTVITPIDAIIAFIVCDGLYLAGKKLWLRLS